MKKDILFPQVTGVYLAAVKKMTDQNTEEWFAVLINRNDFAITNIMITSRGYGEIAGEKRQSSVLRHSFESIDSRKNVVIEMLDKAVFSINNEYWISYFVGSQMFDKKFIFLAGSISDQFLTYIPELDLDGVLHQ